MDRRSFLFRVAGGLLITGTALIGSSESEAKRRRRRQPPRQMLLDADPNDPARPTSPAFHGRERRRTGITDSDSGPNGDPVGVGRGGAIGRFVICPGNARCPRRLP